MYSDDTVKRLAKLPTVAGDGFKVLWDNAYAVHAFDDGAKVLANIDRDAKIAGTQDHII